MGLLTSGSIKLLFPDPAAETFNVKRKFAVSVDAPGVFSPPSDGVCLSAMLGLKR